MKGSNEKVAKKFAGKEGTLLIITIKNNKERNYCFSIKDFSRYSNEGEVLISSFCKYIVTEIIRDEKGNDIVKLDCDNNITSLVNKNEINSSCVVHGRMLLNKKVFEIKDKLIKHDNDEYYLPHALLNYSDVEGFKYTGKYFNLGSKTGFIKASIHYALKDTKQKEDLIKYIKEEL